MPSNKAEYMSLYMRSYRKKKKAELETLKQRLNELEAKGVKTE